MKKILLIFAFLSSHLFAQVTVLPARSGGTGLSTYTVGQIIYASGASTFGRLNIGTSAQVLGISGGVPAWITPSYTSAPTSANAPLSITTNTISLKYSTGLTVTSGSLTIDNTVLTTSNSKIVSNKSIDAGSNTISGITDANLSGSAGITNANIATPTISGISLGSNLANLTNGYGILGGTYNGSTTIAERVDTSCASCPASKLYLAAKLGAEGTVTSFSYTNGNGFTGTVNNASTTPTLSLSLQNATTSQSGQLTSTDWNTFNNKQNALTAGSNITITSNTISATVPTAYISTLTTTGTSGAATVTSGTLNIPQYQSALTNPITGTGTSGQAAFFTGSTTQSSDAKFFWDNTNKMLGVGNNVPISILHVAETSTSTTRGINSDQYSTNTSGSRITMRKARGTFASPTTIVTGDLLGSWTAAGHDGTNFIEGAKILVTSTGTIGTNTVPATMALQTANSAGALTTGLTIDASQNVSVTNSITAGALIKSGGTSSQFLKADGSTDASTYLTGNQTITLSGKVTGSGATSITTSLAAAQPDITTAVNLASIGTVTTGAWNGNVVGVTYGGTGISNATNTSGSILRSNGTNGNFAATTATYPNTATSTQVMHATGTNAWGSSSLFTYSPSTGQLAVVNSVSGVAAISAAGSSGGAAWPFDGTVYSGGANGILRGIISSDANNTALNALVFQRQQTSSPTQVLAGSGIISKQTFNYTGVGNAGNTEMTRTTDYWYNVASKHAKHSFWATYNGTPVEYLTVTGAGVFIGGNTTPSAVLHLAASTASAGTGSLKIPTGTLLTTTEAGLFENNGTHAYFTFANSGTRYQLDQQGVSNYSHNISTPTTGGTVNLTANQFNIINPSGALLALTVSLPSSPSNNDVVYIKYTQNITTVTYSNGTVADGITAPTAGGLVVLVYDSGTTTWY